MAEEAPELVALRVHQRLHHVPGARPGLQDRRAIRAPRVGRRHDLAVLGEERRELASKRRGSQRSSGSWRTQRGGLLPVARGERLHQRVHLLRARAPRRRADRRRGRARAGPARLPRLPPARGSGCTRALPLLDQARVDLLEHGAKIRADLLELLGPQRLRHGLAERRVDLPEVAQQQALAALEAVAAHVVVEAAVALDHLARDRLRPDVLGLDPGMVLGEEVEGGVEELARRLRPRSPRRARGSAPRRARPRPSAPRRARPWRGRTCRNRIGRGSSRIASTRREHVEGVARARRGSSSETRLDQVERERLVQREVPLQVLGDAHARAARSRASRDDLARCPRAAASGRAARPRAGAGACARASLVAALDQLRSSAR